MPKTTFNQRARKLRAHASMRRARTVAGAGHAAPAELTAARTLAVDPVPAPVLAPAAAPAPAAAAFSSVSWPIKSGMSKKHHIAAGSSTTACGSTLPESDGLQYGSADLVDCLRCTRQLEQVKG